MAWRWTARRRALSAFVIFHLSALAVWTMPYCAAKAVVQGPYRYYVMPMGLWQWWAVFAPDPIRNTMALSAEVVDAKGMRYTFDFPRLAELPWWQKIGRYRQPKFTMNMMIEEYKRHREFTARHAVRQLGLDDAAYPIGVCLYVEIKDSPPPGTGKSDPMAPKRIEVVDRFQFQSPREVRP